MKKILVACAVSAVCVSLLVLAGLGVRQVYRSFQEKPNDTDGQRIELAGTLIVHTPNGNFTASGGNNEIELNGIIVTPER